MPKVQVMESELIETIKSLPVSLGVTPRTLNRWLKVVGIQPKYNKDAMFKVEEQENLAAFYIATKFLGLTQAVYAEEVVPRSQVPAIPGLEGARTDHVFGLQVYFEQSYRADLCELLEKRLDTAQQIPQPLVSVIRRLKHEYTAASR